MMADILSERELRELCDKVLLRTSADDAQVRVVSGLRDFTRYARNEVTTSGNAVDTEMTLTVLSGLRGASVTWNDFRDAATDAAVMRAEQLTQLVPEDPEQMPLLADQQYQRSGGLHVTTSDVADADRVDAVVAVIDRVSNANLEAAGFLERTVRSEAVANSEGLFAYHGSTLASHSVTVQTLDATGSGWAGTTHNDWRALTPPGDLADRAIAKARASVNAQPLEPGQYVVVLEPTPVGSLVQLLAPALDARSVAEGRSFFSNRQGGNRLNEQAVDERITLLSDPSDPDLPYRPFAEDGTALQRTVWIENGILSNLAYDRYWAAENGREPQLLSGGLKLTGGAGTVDDLVATVERGLLVTRFWAIRPINLQALVYTGFTRDGTFLIENGRISRSVGDLWFTENLISTLNNIESIGSTERVIASESGGIGAPVAVPPMVVRDFHFTSASNAD